MKYRAWIMLVLSVMTLLCGCKDDEGYGGEFYAVIADNPKNLDPQTASDKESYYVIRNIYGTLIDMDENGRTVAGTAESYEVSEDGLVYTFEIRDGLKWYGISVDEDIPLTAYDYEYAFRRIFDNDTHSPYVELLSNISNSLAVYGDVMDKSKLGVRAEDENTLVISLEKPDCDFLKLLAHPAASPCNEDLFLSTKGRYGLSAEYTFSCGAFYVADWNYDPYWTDNHIELLKITSNSLVGYETYPDSVHIEITDDRSEFEKCNNLIVDSYTIERIEQYTKDVKKNYLYNEYVTDTSFLFFSPASPIYHDLNARKAILSAIEKSGLDAALSADSIPATGFIPDAITVMNKSFREIYPDTSAIISGDSLYWQEFVAEHKDTDFNSSILIVSDKVRSEATAYELITELEDKLELYCTPVFLDDKAFDEKLRTGEFTFGITEISSVYNSARLFHESADAYFTDEMRDSALKNELYKADITSMTESIKKTDLLIYDKAVGLPISFEKRYFLYNEKTDDLWYEPFTDVVFYKYAKK